MPVQDVKRTNYSLIARAIDLDDTEAWKKLYAYYDQFIKLILEKLALSDQDTQQVSKAILANLMVALPQYNQSRGAYRAWFISTIRSMARTHIRQSHPMLMASKSYIDAPASANSYDYSLDTMIHKEWEAYIMANAMKRVEKSFSPTPIQVLQLSLTGHSVAQIAAKLDLSETSIVSLQERVKKSLLQAIKKLTQDLERE